MTLDIVEPLLKRVTQPAWPDYNRNEYSKEEVDRAMRMALAQIRYDREKAKKAAMTPPVSTLPASAPPAPAAPIPPAPKLPRNPRAKKGEE